MEVGHALPRLRPDVGHYPVAVQAQPLGLLGDDGEHVGHNGGVAPINLGRGADVGLRNYQEMGGGLGVDVVEGQALLILIDLVGRNLPGGNLAE